MKKLLSRREFARRCAIALAVIPVTALSKVSLTPKKHLPKLDPSSEQATALSYTHDVDTTEHPNYVSGSNCSNCLYYQGGTDWGKCNIFTSNVVNAKGWCSVWAKQPNFPSQLQPTGSGSEFLNMGP